MTTYVVYTDGGCKGNPGKGSWAFVILKDGIECFRNSGVENHTTNNKMEMTAILQAMIWFHNNGIDKYTVRSDSKYCLNGISNWMHKWHKNNWTKTGGPIRNLDLWKKLFSYYNPKNHKMIFVKGHSGNRWNDVADKMTQDAIKGKISHKPNKILYSDNSRIERIDYSMDYSEKRNPKSCDDYDDFSNFFRIHM